MSDDIELIIQRDLNRLRVFPEERWVPRAGSSQGAFPPLLARAGVLAVAVLLALALGSALTYVREQVNGAASASVPPTPSTTAVASSVVVSRQSVLAHVLGLTGIIPRAQNFEAKLVSSAEVSASLAAPAGSLLWVVAVSGDVNCSFCVLPPPQPLHSALFWFDAYSGSILASAQSPAYWPDGFDALPDRSRASGSRTLVGTILSVNGQIVEFQANGSPDRLRLVGDENTAYTWSAGLAGGSVLTIDELPMRFDLAAGVTFDPIARPDGSYRLEALTTGVSTR